jgi:ABC-type transport system involved in multi-copper enzyme maturation permease subunit
MTARRVGLVAWHVFKESVRDRVLYGIGGFALLLVAGTVLIGQITAGQDLKIIKDLGLATIEIAGALMTIFIGVGLVAREIERRSIFALLAKPLPRWEFIVGKYLGLVLTIAVNLWAMAAALYVVLAWQLWTSPENVRLAWTAPALDPRLMLAVLLITAEMALLTAVALFFSAFSSSALMSVIFTVGIFVSGLASADLRHFGDIVEVTPAVASFVSGIGWALPAFSEFDVKSQVVHGVPVAWGLVAGMLAYAAVYASALVGLTVAVFVRREFK